PDDHPQRGRFAWRRTLGSADGGAASRRPAEYCHRRSHRTWICLARPDRGRDDRHQCRPWIHAFRRPRLLSDRGHCPRHDCDRPVVAADRSASAGTVGTRNDRALGPRETHMSIALKLWSLYVRATNRWPIIATIVPFIPVVALWSIVANSGMFPRAF